MINVDFTNINNAGIIGKILPFWARGRKLSLLLQALLYPLISVHASFQKWALDKYIDCHITAQKASLEWYLKYKLSFHISDESAVFFISQDIDEILDFIHSGKWNNKELWDNFNQWKNGYNIEDFEYTQNQTFVFAPSIVDTISYDHSDYERDIRNVMSKYMINFNKITIIIDD